MELVLASANPAKAAEMAEILRAALGEGVEVRPRPAGLADVVEDAPDLVGNARLKARAVGAATGLVAVADDTGLEVDALGGEPGVRSARYAGEPPDDGANVAKLLDDLTFCPAPEDRTARFRTVVVVAFPDGAELVVEGSVEGHIAPSPRGTGGFGYDPVFEPEGGGGRTFAEMAPAEKHAISHRGRALAALAAAWRGRDGGTGDRGADGGR